MKTLMLLRHAKSDWDDSSLGDFERPLAERGRRDAPRMGKALRESRITPDLVISSPALRARQTVEAFITAAGLEVKPMFDQAIYGASSAELMRIIRRLPDASSCVLLVGHNPGFEDLLGRLTGGPSHLPTAALACTEFDADAWSEVEDGKGRLALFLTPKQLGAA